MGHDAKDVAEFGAIVDRLVGQEFERTLAINSVKLRFNASKANPKGTHYIWIDPPWSFYGPSGFITDSAYPGDKHFSEWSDLFNPLNKAVFKGWYVSPEGEVQFHFAGGYCLVLAVGYDEREEDDWYGHWYAAEALLD